MRAALEGLRRDAFKWPPVTSLVSGWVTSVILNVCIAVAFAGISYTALSGLIVTRQLRSNALGAATAAMFASCAISHATHGLHMVFPIFGIDVANGLSMRDAIDWHLNAVDSVTAAVAVWYWTLRPKFAALLDGGLLFSDLQKRFDHQSRALETKGRLADTLQRALAPIELPTTAAVAFDAFYLPADDAISVGGDWYDVFTLPGGRTAFSIGDVTGHGAEAAAITSRAREAIAAAAFASDDPAIVLQRANEILCERKTAIVTAIFGVIDARGRELRYATAGHPPPILADRDGNASYGAYDGLALSIDTASTYRTFDYALERGTAVVLYTDGVTEFARDLADGDRRLLAAVAHHARLRTASPAKPITRETLGRSRPRDDIAVLVIKMLGDPVIVDSPFARRWTFDVKDSQAATRLRHEVMACVAARAPATAAKPNSSWANCSETWSNTPPASPTSSSIGASRRPSCACKTKVRDSRRRARCPRTTTRKTVVGCSSSTRSRSTSRFAGSATSATRSASRCRLRTRWSRRQPTAAERLESRRSYAMRVAFDRR